MSDYRDQFACKLAGLGKFFTKLRTSFKFLWLKRNSIQGTRSSPTKRTWKFQVHLSHESSVLWVPCLLITPTHQEKFPSKCKHQFFLERKNERKIYLFICSVYWKWKTMVQNMVTIKGRCSTVLASRRKCCTISVVIPEPHARMLNHRYCSFTKLYNWFLFIFITIFHFRVNNEYILIKYYDSVN